MVDQPHNSPLENEAEDSLRSHDLSLSNRVQDLTWALLDERISDDELASLNQLLSSHDTAREAYIDCVQLHTDLQAQFAQPRHTTNDTASAKPPVLGLLNAGTLPLELQSPPAGDVAL